MKKDLGGAYDGLRIMNQPLQNSRVEAPKRSAFNTSGIKTVTFDAAEDNLYGEQLDVSKRPASSMSKSQAGPAYQIKRASTASKSGSGLASHQLAFVSAVKEDAHFSEKDYRKQKKQLLERYRLKNITVEYVN